MKYYYQTIAILAVCVFCIRALVHYEKLEKGANGCKTKAGKDGKGGGVELKVGQVVDDPNTCGVFVCQNTDGDSLIYYCQIPVSFVNCNHDGVSTITPWPECCWKCVNYVVCKNKGANYRMLDAPDYYTNEALKTDEVATNETISVADVLSKRKHD